LPCNRYSQNPLQNKQKWQAASIKRVTWHLLQGGWVFASRPVWRQSSSGIMIVMAVINPPVPDHPAHPSPYYRVGLVVAVVAAAIVELVVDCPALAAH